MVDGPLPLGGRAGTAEFQICKRGGVLAGYSEEGVQRLGEFDESSRVSSYLALALAGDDGARGVQDEQPAASSGASVGVQLLPLLTGDSPCCMYC